MMQASGRSALFLTPEELALLTGFHRKARQIEQLRRMGIAFYINGCGRPIVTRNSVEGRAESASPGGWSPSVVKKVKISPSVRLSREGDRFLMTLVDKDDSANNQTYPVVFVLGGNWEQHFEVQVSEFRFATPMRWVVADKQWRVGPFNNFWWNADGTSDGRPKKPNEMPSVQVGDAKCDGCHTTGFVATKDPANGRWAGTYVSVGVGCELCHGPGGNHSIQRSPD